MPNQDTYHQPVVSCLDKAGWSIIQTPTYISIGEYSEDIRRLYIDLQVQNHAGELLLVEVKSLERSPVHELMQLLGQYLIYKLALDYLFIDTTLYVAIPQSAYYTIMQYVLGRELMKRYAIPLIVFDPILEEIVQWIPQP